MMKWNAVSEKHSNNDNKKTVKLWILFPLKIIFKDEGKYKTFLEKQKQGIHCH